MSLEDANHAGAPDEPTSFSLPVKSEKAAPIVSVRLEAANRPAYDVAADVADDTLSDEVVESTGDSVTLIAPRRHAPLTPPLGLPAFPGMSSVPTVAPLPTQETPALRISRPLRPSQRLTHPLHPQRARNSGPRKRSVTTRPQASLAPPMFLRLGRLLAGLALLGLAWGGAVGVALLGIAMADALRGQTHPTTQLALVAAYGVGALWLAIMTGACLLVSAFALRLGLAQRGW